MSKKLIPAVMLLATLGAGAEVLTPTQALGRLTGDAARRVPARVAVAPEPSRTVMVQGQPAVYLFADNTGAVTLVSAESEAVPLLGYADGYTDGTVPPAMQAMLDYYAAEIADLRAGRVLRVDGAESSSPMAEIKPLCATRWGQSNPYNLYAPEFDGSKAPTGCVATAMSQVLNVLRYPDRCSGGVKTYTNYYQNKLLMLDFDKVTLRWNEMKDTYGNSDDGTAVAELMQAVGYAAEMNYTPGSSGAQGLNMAAGLVKYFGYDPTLQYVRRLWYNQQGWNELIYGELAQGRPVYFDATGYETSAGHAFVIDGYDGNGFFHVNWGWGGASDGYYTLTTLQPGVQGIGGFSTSGYNANQCAIVGMKPLDSDIADAPLQYCVYSSPFSGPRNDVALGGIARFETMLINNGPFVVSSMSPAVKFVHADGTETYIASDKVYKNQAVMIDGIDTYGVKVPQDIKEGTYMLYPAVLNRANNKFYDVRIPADGSGCVAAQVAGTTISFTDNETAKLTFSDVRIQREVYPGTPFTVSATITNNTDKPFYGLVHLRLYKAPGTTSADFERPVDGFSLALDPGESTTVDNVFNFPEIDGEGEYMIQMVDDSSIQDLSNLYPVTVLKRPPLGSPTCRSIEVVNPNKNNLEIEMEFSVGEGKLFSQHVICVIENSAGNRLTYFMSPDKLVIVNGATAKVTFRGSYPGGKAGSYVYANAWYVDANNNGMYTPAAKTCGRARFKLTDSDESGIENVEAAAGATEYFDLQGRRVAAPSHGVYILRQGDAVTKIAR